MCITLTGKIKLKGKCTIVPYHESLKESYVNCLKTKGNSDIENLPF